MRTVVSKNEVCHLWAHQAQSNARTSNNHLFFDGKTIYSYGHHFPIATFVQNAQGETAILFNSDGYSSTTAQHKGVVRRAIPRSIPVFTVPLSRHLSITLPEWTEFHRANIKDAMERTARARSRREWAYSSLESAVSQANAFCQFFGLEGRFTIPSDFDDAIKAQLAQDAAKRAAETKARNEEIRRENVDKIARWKAGESVTLPYNLPDTYLRVEGPEVVTSRGARVPVTHAAMGLRIVRKVVASGESYHRNGHTIHLGHYPIDAIDTDGTLHAGCHTIRLDEIERIAPQLEAIQEKV